MNYQPSINPELVQLWSKELSDKEPYVYPFKASYKATNGQLHFIASFHSNKIESETFKMIQDTIVNEKIDLIILEGFKYSDGLSPKGISTWAKNQGKNGHYNGFETAFTIKTALEKGIPFIGGEPDDSYILSEVQKKGFSTNDLIFYYFVQQVFQHTMNETIDNIDVTEIFKKVILGQKNLFTNKAPSFEEFKEWYLLKNKQEFVLSEINEESPAPFYDGKLYTQKVASAVLLARDQFIVTKIADSLKKNKTVLVVYGGSHWSTQSEALENLYGKPTFFK